MAITAYFIDKDWNYREMLLGFVPLHGPRTGNNLSDVFYQLLKERGLLHRIFSVTTDNATNNETLIRTLQEKLISIGSIGSRESIVRVPLLFWVGGGPIWVLGWVFVGGLGRGLDRPNNQKTKATVSHVRIL
jgi:hypothetical protein